LPSLRNKDCSDKREKCLEGIGDKTDADILAKLKDHEAQIKIGIFQLLKTSDLIAEDFISIFQLLKIGSEIGAKYDCDSSPQQIQAESEKLINDLKAKYGEDKIRNFKKQTRTFLEFFKISDSALLKFGGEV
jgi:hypothetical protein